MSDPRRIAAMRRLFITKLNATPSHKPHEERVEMARKELDKALGPVWRDEVEGAGFGMDPTGDMGSRLDRLQDATKEAGFSGDDVPPKRPVAVNVSKIEDEEEDEDESSVPDIMLRLMKFFGGKK